MKDTKRKQSGITVIFSRTKVPEINFKNKTLAKRWLTKGMLSCEGSERDRYVSMYAQLEAGSRCLDYDAI